MHECVDATVMPADKRLLSTHSHARSASHGTRPKQSANSISAGSLFDLVARTAVCVTSPPINGHVRTVEPLEYELYWCNKQASYRVHIRPLQVGPATSMTLHQSAITSSRLTSDTAHRKIVNSDCNSA